LGGLPDDLAPLLSAFANRPGGGALILGLDEAASFAATGVYDVKKAQQSVTHIARSALSPPVQVSCGTVTFEGTTLVVVQVKEAESSDKPVSVTHSGLAYLRQYDGTYPLSDMERQVFLAARSQPESELRAVTGATLDDLDRDSLAQFMAERRSNSPVFAGWTDTDILTHAHVTTPNGEPTVAGLLAFGRYPQSFLPMSSVQASLWSGPSNAAASRLLDSREFVGRIGVILDEAVSWVARSTLTGIVDRDGGHRQDIPTYPPRAVRELIANALVHRDLGSYVASPVSLILEPGQFIISSVGGLFGIRVEALGKTTSHLRNPHLAGLLLVSRTTDGMRIIERLGSGIPRTLSALQEAGMAPPIFYDNGIRFTARIQVARNEPPRVITHPPESGTATVNGEALLEAIRAGVGTVPELMATTTLSERQIRYALGELTRSGLVTRFRTSGDRRDHFRLR
jgi:ATP-dependent DNA helicase RecG